ncbi:MAG: hypothetical protein R2725_03235 [Solirubrobacterales bacterium]
MIKGIGWLALALLAASVAISACGGGGGGTEQLSKAEFVARGDQICTRAEARKNKALETEFSKMPDPRNELDRATEEELVIAVALPPIEGMIEELRELPAPGGQEQRVEELLASYEDAVAEVRSDPAVAIGGAQPFSAADRLAAGYGFTACAQV